MAADFDDKIFRELAAKCEELRKMRIKVGVLQSHGGSDVVEGDFTLAELAAVHEFGSERGNIPQRSFIRSTFENEANQSQFKELFEQAAKRLLDTDNASASPSAELEKIGLWGQSAVKRTITQKMTTGPDPQENAPETINRKGSSTPLVDTGHLLNSIMYEIVKDDEGKDP